MRGRGQVQHVRAQGQTNQFMSRIHKDDSRCDHVPDRDTLLDLLERHGLPKIEEVDRSFERV